jgi:hypothetical protein
MARLSRHEPGISSTPKQENRHGDGAACRYAQIETEHKRAEREMKR